MKMQGLRSIAAVLLLVLPAGFTAVWRLQHGIDRNLAAVHQERDQLLLRSGRLVKVLSLEYRTFLADVYWTRAVQYFGEKHVREDANLELLAPLLDLTTTLDPNLVVAYHFGAVFLAEPPPRGAGRPDLAVKLLRQGIAANPDQWRLYQDLGFIYYWEVRDYQNASLAFLEGSRNPDAQPWMKIMAAKIAGEGRSRATSMFLWRQVYESTKDEMIRRNALNHMQLIKAEDDMEMIDEVAFDFEQEHSRLPNGIEELVQTGRLKGRPVDPTGAPYVLDREGKVGLSPQSPLAEALRKDRLSAPPK